MGNIYLYKHTGVSFIKSFSLKQVTQSFIIIVIMNVFNKKVEAFFLYFINFYFRYSVTILTILYLYTYLTYVYWLNCDGIRFLVHIGTHINRRNRKFRVPTITMNVKKNMFSVDDCLYQLLLCYESDFYNMAWLLLCEREMIKCTNQ